MSEGLLEKFKRHYGENLLGVALLEDTWLVVVKEGDKVELLIEASQLWEGIDVIVYPKNALINFHTEFFGKFKVLYDPSRYLRKTLSEIESMKGLYSTIKNLEFEVVEVKK
ncbi:hypothetical protein [Thermococcus sp.]|uniref:hypothetical protein n=1 Tax=Thermococcus sp. TaxID=35749 RepID=UPI00261B5854|nr:hypothetical protein [Thermococcus sp.]